MKSPTRGCIILTIFIRWKETVWANATARAGNVWANVNVPVGTVDRERTKKLTSIYNYESLKEKLEDYQKLLKQIESDKPPQLDILKVRNKLSKIIKVTISDQ